jgi:competence protein ComEC
MAKKKSKSSGNTVKVKVPGSRKKVKMPVWLFLVIILVAAVAVGGYFAYSYFSKKNNSSSGSVTTSQYVEGDSAPITFNFIEQGNSHSGDVTYIKAGDNDILIDSGSAKDVAKTAATYMDDSKRQDDYVKDGKLEYVIATHAHEDHIAGFVGSKDSSAPGKMTGLLYHYAVGTLIDFPQTDSTTQIYTDYQTARTYAINAGAKHYTALQCWNNADGASKTYTLGKNLTMTILYNFYYDHTPAESSTLDRTFTKSGFSKENDYSVCVLFTQGNKNFLFTGDAESYAEYSLVKYNALPEVELFKAGHHGSPTASTQKLLEVIKPKMVCICACAGNAEYDQTTDATTFPGQEAIDRIAPYTDRVYVTTLGSYTDKSAHEPFNGNIIVGYDTSGVETVECSNNDTKLKDSAWFKAHRTTPAAWA